MKEFRPLTASEQASFRSFYQFKEGGIRNRGLTLEDLIELFDSAPLGMFIGIAHIFEFKLPERIAQVTHQNDFSFEAPPWYKSGIYERTAIPPDAPRDEKL